MPGTWSAGAEVVVHGMISGQRTATVFHFGIPGPADVTDPTTLTQKLGELAAAVGECIVSTLRPAVTSDWTYIRTEASEIMLGTGIQVTDLVGANQAGTSGPQGVNVACQMIHVRSGQGGRNGLGRNFLPPGSEENATGGEWDAPALALVAAFCLCMSNKFIGGGATTEWRIGVLSQTILGGLFANFDAAFFEAIELETEAIISTMGTRRKGRGA